MQYRPELDGIRAFAVLAVFAAHSGLVVGQGGWMGVDVFFVLSGYLITTILLAESARAGAVSLRSFFARRLLRLYPALVVALGLGLMFYRTLGDRGTLTGYARTAAASALYLENFVWGLSGSEHGAFGHTWSLAVEMQFYLFWAPLLAWLLLRRQRLLAWLVPGIALSYTLMVLQNHQPAGDCGGPCAVFTMSYYMPWTRAFELLAGAAVGVVISRRGRVAAGELKRRWTGWVIVLGLAVLTLVGATWSIFADPSVVVWQSPLATVLTASLIWHLERVRTRGVGVVLAWRPFVLLGKVSYGFYLFHYPVIRVLTENAGIHRSAVLAAAALPITVAIAASSYRWVELPALRMKRRFGGTVARTPSQRRIDPDESVAVR